LSPPPPGTSLFPYTTLFRSGDLDRAAEWTDATMQWAQQHPFAIFPGICRVHRAVVLKRRGALAEAEREALLASDELLHSHVPNLDRKSTSLNSSHLVIPYAV